MTIPLNTYFFKVKRGNQYIWPHERYKTRSYSLRSISLVIKEIEDDFPRHKGKVVAFQMALLKTNFT